MTNVQPLLKCLETKRWSLFCQYYGIGCTLLIAPSAFLFNFFQFSARKNGVQPE